MALKSTISKALLNVANMDTHYYAEHNLTLAQHPSETDLRLMVRVLAFILNADERLELCKGISQEDEPDLWKKSLGGEIELWIDLGQPDEKRIKKACGRSKEVIIYTYQDGMAAAWWKQIESSLTRFANLRVIHLDMDGDIASLTKRSMMLQANLFDGELTLMDDAQQSIIVRQNPWMSVKH